MPNTPAPAGSTKNIIVSKNLRTLGWGVACGAACVSLFCASSAMAGGAGAKSSQDHVRKEPAAAVPAMSADPAPGLLANGFQELYSLNFQGARRQFADYQKARPEDPMGKAAEAASYLFQEFNAKGVLSSEFFMDNDKLLNGLSGSPEKNANPGFVEANRQAREMAQNELKSNPTNTNALLVLTITDGMESDYDQLVERKQLSALSLTRQAEDEAHRLLALDPNAKDAYVALGAAHYIIGCLPGYKRAFLWFGGIHGDRSRGIKEMKIAATQGGYLRPFAKILLALAYRREHQPARARALLAELTEEFPSNPKFAYELSLVEPHTGSSPALHPTVPVPAAPRAECCQQ